VEERLVRHRESIVPTLHSQTVLLTPEQAKKLHDVLDARGFSFEKKPYMIYSARKEKLSIAVYEKGPKAVLQGKGLEDFISFVLEPEILGEARLGYEEVHSPELFSPHFGIDESGKGDLFGPLVIAGVYLDGGLARHLRDKGIQDSKAIGSDKKIRELADAIRQSGAPFEVILIKPEKYNQLYGSIGNLNRLLAWGHARVIENLCVRVPECPRALSDKFADARVLQKALLEKGRTIQLDQRTKAESDYAVAAASILAREGFINWLDQSSKELGVTLAKGVSPKVKEAASTLITQYGSGILPKVAKMHFKTAAEVLTALQRPPS
jgi:ribonuclease HIII